MLRSASLVLAALAATSCSSGPYVDVARPKVYTEDDSLRFLAERRRELDRLATTISAAELQEVHSIRERTSTQVDASLGRKTGDIAEPGAPPESEQKLPTAPTNNVGLSYSELLQRQVTRAQEFAAYDLLYLGDQLIQDQTHRVYMVRLDVSLTASLNCGADPQFVVVQLEVAAGGSPARIYALMPEFSSAAAKEAWSSSVLRDYSGSLAYPIGSFDASVSGRVQKELEESFERLVQQPLQFAIYKSSPGFCAFAIGPRRNLVRRSWANPARWFGSTYRIDYEISPGSRACMALVTVPASNSDVQLTFRRYITTATGLYEVVEDGAAPPPPRFFSMTALSELRDLNNREPGSKVPPATTVTMPTRREDKPQDYKLEFTPKTGGSLVVFTKHPIGSATRAFLDGVAVPLANTYVLGARRLQIDIPRSDLLEARRAARVKNKDQAVATLRLVTPGGELEEFPVDLLEGPSASGTEQKSLWTVKPDSGPGPVTVKLQPSEVSNASFAASVTKVEALLEGGRVDVRFELEVATNTIVVALPAPVESKRAFVDFWITRRVDGKEVRDSLPKAFRYDL